MSRSTAPVASLNKRRGALLLHVGMGREIFKGQNVVRGKTHDAGGIDGAGEFAAGLAAGGSSASAALLSATMTITGWRAARAMSGR